MKTGFSNLNELWGHLTIEELCRCGVSCFVVSPGSRSTPLAFAVSQQKDYATCVHFDERGSAFYALGYARATGKAAAVICTSGTAGANYLPAIVEASVDHVPLIVLTADRPPELRHTGANQTINQVNLYGNHVRFFFDMPCPDENITPEFVLTTTDQAVYRATNSPKGPVHLNYMFREPLAPVSKIQSFTTYLKSIKQWVNSTNAYTRYPESNATISEYVLKQLAAILTKSKSGLIVAGKMNENTAREVLKLSEKFLWPVFPDIASGLRLGSKNENVVAYFDQMLASDRLKFRPTTVLHFGNQLVSKRLQQYLKRIRPQEYIRVADCPERLDPVHLATHQVESNIADFCKRLSSAITKAKTSQSKRLVEVSRRAGAAIANLLETANSSELNEPLVARLVSKNISKSSALFLASSLPVRDMDMFAASGVPDIPIDYNRGASGIDGTIATATGYANGLKKRTTLVIGDLAFLHDLNSLALVRNSKYPLIIVVLNNDGGGIFSFLPVAEISKEFEKFFGTPHGLLFEKSAEQFGLSYHNPTTQAEFIDVYKKGQNSNKSSIIEIKTERKANYELHKKILNAVKKIIDKP